MTFLFNWVSFRFHVIFPGRMQFLQQFEKILPYQVRSCMFSITQPTAKLRITYISRNNASKRILNLPPKEAHMTMENHHFSVEDTQPRRWKLSSRFHGQRSWKQLPQDCWAHLRSCRALGCRSRSTTILTVSQMSSRSQHPRFPV